MLLERCHCERDKAFIALLWYSGVRLSEAINIRESDFNWSEDMVTVLGKGKMSTSKAKRLGLRLIN
jgi:integrase